MAKRKGSSKHQKDLSTQYKTEQRWKSNRIQRLQRHVAKHPEDQAAAKALENPEAMTYRRNRKAVHKLDTFMNTLAREIKRITENNPVTFNTSLRNQLIGVKL